MTDTITVTGNVATIPELKHTPTGVPFTTFRVASAQRRFDRASGAWVEAGTNWYTVSAFRGLAEHTHQSLHKGDRVLLTGRLRLRAWDTGVKQGTSAEIDAEAIGHDLLWGTTRFEKVSRADSFPPPSNGDDSFPATTEESSSGERVVGDWGAQIETPDDARELTRDGVEVPF